MQPSLKTLQRLVNPAYAVMTIEVDGVRLIDTTRFPTVEEMEAMDAAAARQAGDPAAGGWVRMLGEFEDTLTARVRAVQARWIVTPRSCRCYG